MCRQPLQYQTLLEILQSLSLEDRSYVLHFLLSNDQKVRSRIEQIEQERRELARDRDTTNRKIATTANELAKIREENKALRLICEEQRQQLAAANTKIANINRQLESHALAVLKAFRNRPECENLRVAAEKILQGLARVASHENGF